MNKTKFLLLVFLMSISMIGIILVQIYWINSSYKKNDEQFKHHTHQVLNIVSKKLDDKEIIEFYNRYFKIKDSLGKEPKKEQLRKIYFYEKDAKTKETVIYTNTIIPEDYGINGTFFDKNANPISIKNFITKRKTEIYRSSEFDKPKMGLESKPNYSNEKTGNLEILDRALFYSAFRDIVSLKPIQYRISNALLQSILETELKLAGIKTPFEFAIYSNKLATKVRSEKFKYDKNLTYSAPILLDADGNSKYELLVQFPNKSKYVFSELVPMSVLSLLFTIIIILTYSSALRQLITQKQISEIKTDFINNMTHEFKTPIATINLALDAIKNPKIIDDKEKVQKYLQMIKDENKRMHAQVENVLRISKLEKRELDIYKEPNQVEDFILDAIDHVSLILEDKEGEIHTHFEAQRSTVLLNDMHFTNVIVNILENAIKYTIDKPIINVYTENVKDFIVIKIEDNGIGMSKSAQKKAFDKFFREHTGDVHNVKGHGLGLAYVKQILDDHNGQIFVESEKGKGSIFIIKLPLIN